MRDRTTREYKWRHEELHRHPELHKRAMRRYHEESTYFFKGLMQALLHAPDMILINPDGTMETKKSEQTLKCEKLLKERNEQIATELYLLPPLDNEIRNN